MEVIPVQSGTTLIPKRVTSRLKMWFLVKERGITMSVTLAVAFKL